MSVSSGPKFFNMSMRLYVPGAAVPQRKWDPLRLQGGHTTTFNILINNVEIRRAF
jgi:hypothetical protein